MNPFRSVVVCILSLLATGFCNAMSAQTAVANPTGGPGITPFGSYLSSDIYNIDLSTGNVHATIPLGSYKQLGQLPSFDFFVQLNDPVYRQGETCDPTTDQCWIYFDNAGGGAHLESSYSSGTLTETEQVENDAFYYTCGGSGTCTIGTAALNYSFTDHTGHSHPMLFDASTTNPTKLYALDGSGYTAVFPAGSSIYNPYYDLTDVRSATLLDPNGMAINHHLMYATDAAGYQYVDDDIVSYQDTLRNKVQVDHSFSGVTATDSVGRRFLLGTTAFQIGGGEYNVIPSQLGVLTPTLPATSCPNLGVPNQTAGSPLVLSLPGVNNTILNYVICYTTVNYHTNYFDGANLSYYASWPNAEELSVPNPDGDTGVYITQDLDTYGSFDAIQSITLPTGEYWGFVYDSSTITPDSSGPPGNFDATEAYGGLAKIIYPTGATASFTRQRNGAPLGTPGYPSNVYQAVSSEVVMDGVGGSATTGYYFSPTSAVTEVTDPNNNVTKHIFNDLGYGNGQIYEVETDWYAGPDSSKPMKTVTNQFQSQVERTWSGGMPLGADDILPYTTSTVLNGVSQTSTVWSYSPLGTGTNITCILTYGEASACYPSILPISLQFAGSSSTTVSDSNGNTLRSQTVTPLYISVPAYQTANILSPIASAATYDSLSQLVAKTVYGYDEANGSPQGTLGKQTSVTEYVDSQNTLMSQTVYSPNGMLARQIDSKQNITAVTQTQCGGLFPQSITSPYQSTTTLPETTTYIYDCNTGQQTASTDPNGVTSLTVYNDPLGRPTEIGQAVGTPAEAWTQISYPGLNQIHTAQDQKAAHDGLIQSSTSYDGFGRVIQQRGPNGSTVSTTYNLTGHPATVTNPSAQGTPGGAVTSMFYDPLGRMVKEVAPDGGTQWWCYNGIQDSVYPQPNCSSPANTNGGAASWTDTTDEAGKHWQHVSDALGRLVAVMEPGQGSNALNLETDYSYDALGDLKTVNQLGLSTETPRTRTFSYDSLSRLLCSSNPETNQAPTGGQPVCPADASGTIPTGAMAYTYDANGNVLTETDANGTTTNFTYDGLNRLTLKSYSSGGSNSFLYDGAGHGASIGRLTHASNNANAAYDPTYDAMGRVTSTIYCLPSNCSYTTQVSAAYDLAGNMTDLWYPDGHHVQQTFDAAGRLSTSALADISGTPQAQSYVESILYNPDNSPSILTLGNGVAQTVTKNNRLQVQSMTIGSLLEPFDGSTFLSHSYCRVSGDPNCSMTMGAANNGNIWGITDNLNGARSQAFTYDSLNRIQSFSLGGALYQQYQIDSFGNMSGAYNVPYISCFDPATNRMNNGACSPTNLTSGPLPPSLAYDSDGNLTQDTDPSGSPRTFVYDAENRISSIAITGNPPFETYVYGADGARVEKVNTAQNMWTEYVNFNGQPIAELDKHGNWTDYIYANGQKVARVSATSHRLHLSGSALQSGAELGVSLPAPANYVVQSGDKVCWQQAVNNAVGGIALFFGNGSNTAWHSQADDGQDFNQDFTSNGWHSRCGDISEYQGQSLVGVQALKDVATPVGGYDLMIADWVLIHPDGTVVQVLTPGINPPLTIQLPDPQYEYFFNAVVEDAGVVQGPSVPVNQVTVRFTNDSCTQCGGSTAVGAGDRNLFINSISVGGTTFLPTDTTDQVSCFQCAWAGGIAGDGVQGDSGDLTFTFATQQSGTVTVNAYGSPDLNLYPNMQVLVNGVPVSDFTVTGTAQTYTVTAAGAPTYDTYFMFSDHLGSAQLEFSAGGWPVSSSQFAPFGGELDGQISGNHYKFTGKERDAESGLDYFGARYYASSMGRFSSPDPSGLYYANPRNPQSLNLYSYAVNNPLRWTDPTGMAYCQWDDGSHDDSANTGVEGAVNSGSECTGAGGTWSHDDGLNDDGSQMGSEGKPAFTTTATLNTATDQTTVSTSGPYYDPQVVYNYMLFQQIAKRTAGLPDVCSGGVFMVRGKTFEVGVAEAATGVIAVNDSQSGASVGALAEGSGGEGITGGGGAIYSTEGAEGFAFSGVSAQGGLGHAEIGAGAGVVAFKPFGGGAPGVGVYAEGSAGGSLVEYGAYANVSTMGQCAASHR